MSVCPTKFISSIKSNQDCILYMVKLTGEKKKKKPLRNPSLNLSGSPILTFSDHFNVVC